MDEKLLIGNWSGGRVLVANLGGSIMKKLKKRMIQKVLAMFVLGLWVGFFINWLANRK